MTDLVKQEQQLVYTPRVLQELMRQGEQMQLTQGATQLAMEQLSRVYAYGSFEVARTMATAQMLRQARAGQLSPLEQAGYEQLDMQYFNQMARLTQAAGERILQQAQQAQLGERNIWDDLFGR